MQSFNTPDHIVRVERMNENFKKFHLGDGRVLHHFTGANDEYFHDHPWSFQSSILSGGYREEVATIQPDGTFSIETFDRLPGTTHQVMSGTIHRLTALLWHDLWTLVKAGPEDRKSAFYKADQYGIWQRYWDESTWKILVPGSTPS